MNLQLLIPLVAGHLIGDFVLQTNRMVADKRRIGTRLSHAVTVAIISWALVGHWATWWWLLPALVVTHFLIDTAKSALEKRLPQSPSEESGWLKRNGEATLLVVDQVLHLAVILGLVRLAEQSRLASTVVGNSAWIDWFDLSYLRILVLVSGFVLAVNASGVLLGILLKRFEQAEEGGLPGGGLYIGFFERALIFIFVLAGEPAGIGFLAAAKSVFRFGELKDKDDRATAEYILIGTLMSFCFAMVIAYTTRYVLGKLGR